MDKLFDIWHLTSVICQFDSLEPESVHDLEAVTNGRMTNVKSQMKNKSVSSSDNSLRVLLWDLDGTLVRGARYGIFKDYTIPMLESVFGTAGSLGNMIVSGMTDLQIVEEALRGA